MMQNGSAFGFAPSYAELQAFELFHAIPLIIHQKLNA
jgi:hypothetical protein